MIISCPYCQTRLDLPNGMVTFRCPTCNRVVDMNAQHAGQNVIKQSMAAPGTPGAANPQQAFDIVRNGAPNITCSQMVEAFKMIGLHVSDDVCNQLLLKHDTDRSGRVEFGEFNAIINEINEWSGVFSFFDTDHSGRMEYQEFCDALVKMGYNFSQPIVTLIFSNLDHDHVGYLVLDGFIKACSVIQIVMMKMQQYDPQRRGSVTIDINQMMDIVFSVPM